MEVSELKATTRRERGKGPAGRMRRGGSIPAVLYGPAAESILLKIDGGDLLALLKKKEEHVFIKLLIDDDNSPQERLSIIKELQIEPLTGSPQHADFYEITLDHEFHFEVPVHFTGTPAGVGEEEGELLFLRREIKVSCLPTQLPEFIAADISGLHVGDSLKIEELTIGEGITVHDPADTTLVTVVAGRHAAGAVEAEEGVAVSAPEVIKQKAPAAED
jgi:large subunit ribosomal protein L25